MNLNQPHLCVCVVCIMFVLDYLVLIRLVESHHKPCRVQILSLGLLLILIIIQIGCDMYQFKYHNELVCF